MWSDACISVKFQSNKHNFIHEDAIENIVCKITAILFRHQCVKFQGPAFFKLSLNQMATASQDYIFNMLRATQNGRHFADSIFKCISLKNILNFDWNFNEGCFWLFNQQYDNFGSDNSLTPNRQQATDWSSAGIVLTYICATWPH